VLTRAKSKIVHREVAERIHIVRRLEFGVPERIPAGLRRARQILLAVLRRKAE
jgi:hypothetical protein